MKIYEKSFKDSKKLEKEIYCLEKLKKYNCFPKIIKKEKDSVTLEHCGEVFHNYTYIPDWKAQIKKIIAILEKENIFQNDMIRENFVQKNEKIYLIDFEKSSIGKPQYPWVNITTQDLERSKSFSEMLECVSFRIRKKLKNELGTRKSKTLKKR
jgi:predicted Ser/Thr protein kinase